MLVQLTSPLTLPYLHALGRVVVNSKDPLSHYAPPADVWMSPAPDSWTTKESKFYYVDPRGAWLALKADVAAMASVRALFTASDTQRHFVVGATVLSDGTITQLDYAEVTMNGDRSFDFYYEDSLPTSPAAGATNPGRSGSRRNITTHLVKGAEAGFQAAGTTKFVTTTALAAAGFKATGVAKNTMASGWHQSLGGSHQSLGGSVSRGSLFSRLQSYGAKGGLPVMALVATGVAVGAVVCAVGYYLDKEKEDEDEDNKKN